MNLISLKSNDCLQAPRNVCWFDKGPHDLTRCYRAVSVLIRMAGSFFCLYLTHTQTHTNRGIGHSYASKANGIHEGREVIVVVVAVVWAGKGISREDGTMERVSAPPVWVGAVRWYSRHQRSSANTLSTAASNYRHTWSIDCNRCCLLVCNRTGLRRNRKFRRWEFCIKHMIYEVNFRKRMLILFVKLHCYAVIVSSTPIFIC